MSNPKANETTTDPKVSEANSRRDGMRETIESIVIAFIFAFLFRTFEAEAFVIPTGSMAPTLYGRHKDETCHSCGFQFAVGASEELDQETGLLKARFNSATCPNCRATLDIREDPVFVGDRILVTKFNYKISDPDRWDVTVFKYPEDPSTNYIKRLCGLPGETIEVRQGDLYRINEGRAEILRKHTAAKLGAVLQTVYDDAHPPLKLLETGWPERWAPVALDDGPEAVAGWSNEVDGWQPQTEKREYRLDASPKPRWLRYRHFVPTEQDWQNFATRQPRPRARLILDFIGYDTPAPSINGFFDRGVYWVGDLALSARLDIEQIEEGGEITLELVEGSRRYRCVIDPHAGEARLSYLDGMQRPGEPEAPQLLSKSEIAIDSPGSYDIRFANIDDRLWLSIDSKDVPFDTPAYEPFMGLLVQSPTADDLTPVGIAAKNVALTVSNLKLDRDIYYRSEVTDPYSGLYHHDRMMMVQEVGSDATERRLHDLADRPEEYATLYNSEHPWSADETRRMRWFPLEQDEFLLLGDNSPRSMDSRLWPNSRGAYHRHAVHRDALVGKALFIFWPHGLRIGNTKHGQPHGWTLPIFKGFFYHKQVVTGPDGQPRIELVADYPAHGLPFYPDFERMTRRIR